MLSRKRRLTLSNRVRARSAPWPAGQMLSLQSELMHSTQKNSVLRGSLVWASVFGDHSLFFALCLICTMNVNSDWFIHSFLILPNVGRSGTTVPTALYRPTFLSCLEESSSPRLPVWFFPDAASSLALCRPLT